MSKKQIFAIFFILILIPCLAMGFQYARVTGISMTGIANEGTFVAIYPIDREIHRNDLVVYPWAGRKEPLIKRVLAIAGDTLSLDRVKGHILINGIVTTTSFGQPYSLNDKTQQILALYQGEIPHGALLIMGNLQQGSQDGSRFGLVSANELIGFAVPVK